MKLKPHAHTHTQKYSPNLHIHTPTHTHKSSAYLVPWAEKKREKNGGKIKIEFPFRMASDWISVAMGYNMNYLKGILPEKNKPIEMELLEEKATTKYKSTKYHKKCINPEHKRKEPFDEYHKQKTKSNWIINKPVRIKLKLESPT